MRHGEKALYRAFGAARCAEERHGDNKKGAGRRALALLLAFMLCVSFVPVTASASSSAPTLRDEFTLSGTGIIEIGGEYYATADAQIGFSWSFNPAIVGIKNGNTNHVSLGIGFSAADESSKNITLKDFIRNETEYYYLGYWNAVAFGGYTDFLDSNQNGDKIDVGSSWSGNDEYPTYDSISGTNIIGIDGAGRYEFYPELYFGEPVFLYSGTRMDDPLPANLYESGGRYGANAEPIVINVLGEGSSLPADGSTVVMCTNGTLSNVYGLEGAEPLLYTTGSGFGFRATAEGGGAVTGAYYTYHDSNGSTVSSGPCVDVGGYYTVTLPADSNAGTSTPYVEITLLTNDTGVTVATDATNATVSGIDTETGAYRPGDYVSFTVEAEENYAVADVYATYTYGAGTDTRSLTVQSAGDRYYFYIPEDFGGAAAPTVTVHVATVSTARQETTVSVELDETSYMPGDVLTATATVNGEDGNALTDIPGSVVSFTMPDGTIVSGFVDDTGVASATWVVTDEFVKDNPTGQVTAHFGGTGEYESSTSAAAEASFATRTISAGTAAITVDPALKVNSTSTLTLSGNIVAGNTTLSYEDGDYTIEWFRSEDGGAWASMGSGDTQNGGTMSVTPRSTNTSYMAVVRGAGSYIGELSFVISNSPELDGTDRETIVNNSGNIYEGQGVSLTTTLKSDSGTVVNGGTVRFWARLNNAEENTRTYLGEAAVVGGSANLVLASVSLPVGQYSIYVEYSGVPGVFDGFGPSGLSGASTGLTVYSATLVSDDFSLSNRADGENQTNLVPGVENTIRFSDTDYTLNEDYTYSWMISTDGGLSWSYQPGEAYENEDPAPLTITPTDNRWMVRALVMPMGDYTKPANGLYTDALTVAAGTTNSTSVALTAEPASVFEGGSVTLTAVVTDTTNDGVPVTGGSVTLTSSTDTGWSVILPVGANGTVQYTVTGLSATTEFTATYNDASGIYAGSEAKTTVTVNSRTIAFGDEADEITVSDENYAVGDTVTLTAPAVYSEEGTQLTAGEDFYYQWQYSTDYDAGEGGEYTATWLNFSAPGEDDGSEVRVTIGDANTAFRVVAMPYGDYLYPAQGLTTEPVCGGAERIDTEVSVSVRSVENMGSIYDGYEITITASVTEAEGGAPVSEGYVVFMIQKDGQNLTIGTAEVASNGVATFNYTAYADRMDAVSVNYLGTDVYNAVWGATVDVNVHSVTIYVTQDIAVAGGGTLTAGTEAEITPPVVVNADREELELETHYYIEWLVDDGSGWYPLADPQYADNGNLLYTPANENSKLAAVVYPLSSSNYSEPAEGIAAGVVGDVEKIDTSITLEAGNTGWYEGEEVVLTATVVDGGDNPVYDGYVEFFVRYDGYTSTHVGTVSLNSDGQAVLIYTLPAYGTTNTVEFYAEYMGTDVYNGSKVDEWLSRSINSATITFGADPAIAIDPAGDIQVGESYTLTAPEVYERGNTAGNPLTCGTDYYYIWEYSEDNGVTWEVVQSDLTAEGKTLENAVFQTNEGEYRATAYPLVGSGTIYRYPANGISVVTNTNPGTIATVTSIELGNEYTTVSGKGVYPYGREVTLTATVARDDDTAAPAYGVVEFYYKASNTDTGTLLGSMNLDPGGQATLTVAAPGDAADEAIYYAVFTGNEVFTDSTSSQTDANASIVPNEIEMTGTLTLYNDEDCTQAVNGEPVVGETYYISGAQADAVMDDGWTATNNAVNDEQLNGDPYYRYEWQISANGGQTWTAIANADITNVRTPVLEIEFDSSYTQYRLVAYPVSESGWTSPATGVASNAVTVDTTATEVTITLLDADGNPIGDQGEHAYEGSEIQVVVNVGAVSPEEHLGGTDGTVTLEVTRFHTGGQQETVVAVTPATSDVDANGNAVFTVTLPGYSYDVTQLSNQINFKASYSGDDYYSASSVAWQDYLHLDSRAITWDGTYEGFAEGAKDIVIYEGTDTSDTETPVTEMVANTDYTLVLPAIYAGDISTDNVRTGERLVNGVHYTVEWQRQLKGAETATGWERVPTGNGGDSLYVASGAVEYSYRAVVSPMGDYEFAMDDTFGTLTDTRALTSNPTTSTGLTETVTGLVVSEYYEDEPNSVEIAAEGEDRDHPFEDLGADGTHMTEYEGGEVTLTATVTEAGDVSERRVNEGNVYFYRYVDGTNDVRLNDVGVEVDSNGVATLTVNTSEWDDDGTAITNVDRYYAVYEGTGVFEASSSMGADAEGNPTGLQDVYIRSTAIETPRISTGAVLGANSANSTTNSSDLTGLPAAVEITFALVRSDGSATSGYSVTATDGRWLTAGKDYSIQWYREEATVDEGGSETGVDSPITGATSETYTKAANSVDQKFSVQLNPEGHMTEGAKSYRAIIGSRAEPVVSLDPGYTFTPSTDGTEVAEGVQVIDGAHYGDEVTMTATVRGEEGVNALPTGTVQFWYRTGGEDGQWVMLGDPVTLTQKDAHENEFVAEAELVVDTTGLPFNIDRVGFSYSGDNFYDAYTSGDMHSESDGAPAAQRPFKLWSVQISNPAHEPESEIGGTPGEGYTPDYSDPKHYPDGVSYGNVTISVYEYDADNEEGNYKGTPLTDGALVSNSRYVLEVGDIYTKSGEKLEFMHDNSGDITVEWFVSTDGGATWGPLPLDEYTNIDGRTITVTPETRDHKYMVKVTTSNSFYNYNNPSLVDFEYSEENVDTILQQATVSVTAEAAVPVNGVDEWVYQLNPITLTATVTPEGAGEPGGHVEFYYGWAIDGSATGDYSDVEWTHVESDGDPATNVAELVKVTSGTDTDGVMQASITTSGLPVSEDGTYGQLVIMAVYTGDQTYAACDNINDGSIDSDVVTVFSSVALQDKENIENQVLDMGTGEDGAVTWTNSAAEASGDQYDGILITGKNLVSDGSDTTLTLLPIYTLDVNDRLLAFPGYDPAETTLEDIGSGIYTLQLNVDYSVEWQYCATYEAYQGYLEGSDEGRNWSTVPNATSSDTCSITQVDGYAFRAKITFNNTEKARAAWEEFDNYGERVLYSNILLVGDATGRLFTNIRNASSASANGDTVYIDALIMGGSTTPVGSLSVNVTDRGGAEVFSDSRSIVNGGTTFTWTGAAPGEYTITTTFAGNNGYAEAETSETYIVRFTSTEQTGGAGVPGVLSISAPSKTVTYNGQAQMLSGGDVTISGFGDYTEWAALAGEAMTFQYFDESGNRVAEPTEAGTYTVKAYLPETMYWGYVEAWGTYTISQRGVSIADVTAQAKTYDGFAGVNIQAIELEQSATDGETGLPSGSTGVVEGDSLYVSVTGALSAAGGGDQTLRLVGPTLMGPDAGNYYITNTDYTESFTVSRSQLYGDAYDSITAAPGYRIGDDDFYMIAQDGSRILAQRAVITYYYHSGNEIAAVSDTGTEGKYTVVISGDDTNYKGGLTLTLWIQEGAATAKTGSVDSGAASSLIDIEDTYYVYDGQPHGVTATATTGESVTVEYAGADGNYSTAQPTDAGRYMVRAYTGTGEGGELLNVTYGIMTIVKGGPQINISAETAQYDGNRYGGNVSWSKATLDEAKDPVYGEAYYTYVGGSITGYSYNAPRDVSYTAEGAYDDGVTSGAYGPYMVTVHVPETANTIAVTASAGYEITKAPLTIRGEDIYSRLYDSAGKFTSLYEGFVGDDYGHDSEIRDLIAMPTYTIGGSGETGTLTNAELSHAGYLDVHQSGANARNYEISYVDGELALNVDATGEPLEIRGEPETIYYGDEFQLFLYGSRGSLNGGNGSITNESSLVTWTSSAPDVATVDPNGNVTILGAGEFTITAARGDDPDTQISISETYEARQRRNDIVMAREDKPYNNNPQSVDEVSYSFYYMLHGTLFESQDPLSVVDDCTISGVPRTDSGEYPVSASVTGGDDNAGDGSGLLVIHRVNSTITPKAQTSEYGTAFTFPASGSGYAASNIVSGDNSPADALANGLVQADARYNSDAGGYEILVAGGTEGRNYNVSYATYTADSTANDYDITPKALTFTVGSLAGTEGSTKQWRNEAGELEGSFLNMPGAAFENEGDRVFGDLNQALDYLIGEGLIDGDSLADLWDTGRGSAEFAVLNDEYELSAESAANELYINGDRQNNEVGTLDHVRVEDDIDHDDYIITGHTNSKNYNVNITNGRLDVTQRPVSIANTTVVVPAGTGQSDLMSIIGPQLDITGLAENLEHDYRDLLLSISGSVNTGAGAGEQTVTLTSGNTNYYLDPDGDTITVVVGTITANGEFIVKQPERTVLRIQRTITPENGSTYVEPAGGIDDLELTITATYPASSSGDVLVAGTMTELHPGDSGWNSSWDGDAYAYYELDHSSLLGYRVEYTLDATGYVFRYVNN